MVDNVTANAGSGGATFATDYDATAHHPYTKMEWGADNTQTKVDTGTGALPVQGADAENAAVTANPVLAAGRYDSSARTLGDGDVGSFALSASGHVIVDTLPAGTNAIGKLAANSGVDIGDVDVTSVIAGTGATNLGKAIDSAVGATDTGIALLAKHKEDQIHLTTADGDYDVLTLDSLGSLHVNPEAHHIFDELDSTSGWTVLGNDTANLATTTKHVMGTAALTFDKVNGAANTVFAGIQKTLSSTDLGAVSPHDILQGSFYISDLTNVSYVFLRLGTDSSNYNEWRLDAGVLTAGVFETGALTIGDADYTGITGNGMNSSAITYISVGVAFNTETDTLSGIIFDQLSYHTNQHTATSINSEVTSSVSSANVNINKVANKTVNTQAGNVGTGTQRVTIATDDANLSAIKTSVELIDDAIYTDSDAWVNSTSKHLLTGGVYNASPRSITDGDTGPFAMDVNGHIITSAHAGSVALADNVSNTANLMVDEADAFMASATFGYNFDGAAWDRIRGDATDGLLVNLGTNNDVTVTGTVTVDGSGVTQPISASSLPLPTGAATSANQSTANSSLSNIEAAVAAEGTALGSGVLLQGDDGTDRKNINVDATTGDVQVDVTNTVTVDLGANNDIQGDVAHDTADSGNPIKIGAKAETALSGVTLVADGDRVDLAAGVDGVLITRPHANLEDLVDGNASNTDGSSTQVIAAGGVGIKQYLLSATITNTSATDTYCEIKSGTTVKWTVPVPANGGATLQWPAGLKPNAANEAWNFDMGAAVTTAYCSMSGFKSKV